MTNYYRIYYRIPYYTKYNMYLFATVCHYVRKFILMINDLYTFETHLIMVGVKIENNIGLAIAFMGTTVITIHAKRLLDTWYPVNGKINTVVDGIQQQTLVNITKSNLIICCLSLPFFKLCEVIEFLTNATIDNTFNVTLEIKQNI